MSSQEKLSELGNVVLKPSRDLDAGSRVTLVLTYTVGVKGIAEGGGLAIGFPETWESPVAPLSYTVPWQPKTGEDVLDRVRAYSPRNIGVELTTEGLATPRLYAEQSWARVVVVGGPLAAGDRIVFTYGDTTWGSDGAFIGNAPRDDQSIGVFADIAGNGDYHAVPNSPIKLSIVAGPPVRLHVVVPSLLESEEEFRAKVAVTDERQNRSRRVIRCHLTGKPVVVVKKGRRRKSRTLFRQMLKEEENNSKFFDGLRLDGEGVLKVAVSDETGEIFGLSNPILLNEPKGPRATAAPPEEKQEAVPSEGGDAKAQEGVQPPATPQEQPSQEPAEAKPEPQDGGAPAVEVVEQPEPHAEEKRDWQIFWGDIHGKTQYTAGATRTTPDQYYSYGREVGLLDFCAITDEGAGFKEEAWAAAQEAARKHHRPGEFVTFKAFQWASSLYGHRSVYFPDDGVEGKFDDQGNLEWLDVNAFFSIFRERDVLIVPQNTFVWMDWGFHDPVHERVVEVYSSWGASERHGDPMWNHSEIPGGGVQAALARGYRLGMIASSDTHFGMPGRSYPGQWSLKPFKGGLAAVYAKELSRQAVFEALRNRHCYGTTGARIVVKFTVNDQPMGSEIEMAWENNEAPRRLKIAVVGAGAIKEIVIVRNNRDIYRESDCGDAIEFDYEDDEPMREALDEAQKAGMGGSSLFYYLRVTQKDGEMAWCSPVWVSLGGPPEPGKVQK